MLKKYIVVATCTLVVETFAENIDDAKKWANSAISSEIELCDINGSNFTVQNIIETKLDDGQIY